MDSSGAASAAGAATSSRATPIDSFLSTVISAARAAVKLNAREVLGVDPALEARVAALGQGRALVAALERVQILEVLLEEPARHVAPVRWAVTRNDRLRFLQKRPEPRERGAVVRHGPVLGDPRDLDS